MNDKSVLATINKILEENYDPDLEDFNWPELYSHPYFEALIKETLRLHSNVTSARQVTRDTAISIRNEKEYSLKKNEVVILVNDIIHWNENLYPEPMEWKPERFLNTPLEGDSQDKASVEERAQKNPWNKVTDPTWNSYIAWGGGKHMCAGRFFAKNEMIISLVYTVWYLNVEFLEPIPEGYVKERFGTGAVHPSKGLKTKISRRRPMKV